MSRKFRNEPTVAEQRLWQALRKKQVGGLRFRRQQVIDGFVVDFYCHEAALIIEVDGRIHEQQKEYDENRSRVLAQRGLTILRFANQDVFENLSGCLVKILDAAGIAPP